MAKAQKKCLVTGGAGFIGSHMAKRLLQEGFRVWVIDDLTTGFESNIPGEAEFIRGNIADPSVYDRLGGAHFDAVVHLAAQSSGETSFYDPFSDLASNGEGTLRLLEFCRCGKVPKFVFSSTMSVYGIDDAQGVKESEPCRPHSLYGATKVLGEQYVRLYARYGIAPVIFRLFSVYGPGQNMDNMRQGIVSIYLSFLLRGEPIHVKGSLDRYRDFIYIDDVVNAFMLAIESPAADNGTFNLGTGIMTRVGELIDAIKKTSGRPDHPVFSQGNTPGDITGITADIRSITGTLPWKPGTTLTDGLARMFAFYKDGPVQK